MRASYRERPPWLARVGDVGAGVIIAPDLVLTCSHVVPHDSVDVVLVQLGLTVAASVEFRDDDGDLAVLRLVTPVSVVCAPLRAPTALSDHTYVVQGFAGGHHTESRGRLGGRVGPGWVQLEHTSGHRIDRGFSGAPVWDDTLQAVVGIVVTAHKAVGGGNLIPVEEIVRLWPSAALYTGWRVDLDDAFDTHWLPRARGVEPHEPTDVWHFVGRHRALHELAFYLQGQADGRVRAVVGSPGSGKSAVLARTVVLADRAGRPLVPMDSLPPEVALPPVGSVTIAVHARGKTLMDVVRTIADAAEVEAADQTELLQRCGPISVVVDALDEATGDAPMAIATMLNRLATHPERHVVVGTRAGARGSNSNTLLTRLGDPVVLNLDSESYLDHQDVVHYAERRLDDPARAAAIAEHAGGNFLIAQLACLTGSDRLPASVGAAVDDYLSIRFDDPRKARELLLPLVFAKGAGLPEGPEWLALANALNAADHTPRDLRDVLMSAASYLVERADGRYRLFHQSLDDALRDEHHGRAPEQIVYETLRARVVDWSTAPDYTLVHLVEHAVDAGRLDELVEDLDFVLAADPLHVVPHLARVTSARAMVVRHVYRRAVHGFRDGGGAHRTAYFRLQAMLNGFPDLAGELPVPQTWRAEVLAWWQEDAQQMLADLPPRSVVGLWFDARGAPAAFTVDHDGFVLHRYEGYRLVEAERLPTDGRLAAFKAHAHMVLHDGREAGLTVSKDCVLRLWSFTGGLRLVHWLQLPGSTTDKWVVDAVVTPAGRALAVVAGRTVVELVDLTSESITVLHSFRIDDDWPRHRPAAAIGVQNDEVHVAYRDGSGIRVAALRDAHVVDLGLVVDGLSHFDEAMLCFAPHADGTHTLLVSSELRVQSTPDSPVPVGTVTGTVTALTASALPDGRTVAGIGTSGTLALVDATVTELAWLGELHNRGVPVTSVAVGTWPTGIPVALTGDADGRVRMWDIDHVPPEPTVPVDIVHSRESAVRLLPTDDGAVIAVVHDRRTLELLSVTDRVRPEHALPLPDTLAALAVADGHPDIALITKDGRLELRRRDAPGEPSSPTQSLPGDWFFTSSAALAQDDSGVHVVSASREHLVWATFADGTWDVTTLPATAWFTLQVLLYRLSGEPRLLVNDISGVHLHRRGARLATLLDRETNVNRLAVGSDAGEPVMVLTGKGLFDLYSLGGDVLTPWSRPRPRSWSPVEHVAVTFPARGHALVATGTSDGRVVVWLCHRSGTPREVAAIPLHSTVQDLVWTHDRQLVVWYENGVLKLDGFA